MKHVVTAACLMLSGTQVHASDGAAEAGISLELNTLSQVETGCQLTFLTSAGYAQGVEKVVFETVLFDAEGAVTLLTLFDFGTLPPGRPRVRQFVIPRQNCAGLGSILINGVTTCSVPGFDESTCQAGLTVSSRTEVELIG
ncbi:MAG: hypothetical protein AAF999_07900 [Pseudomonadota bacterium]